MPQRIVSGQPLDEDATILGADPNDLLGHSLAAGDIDGDGTADIIAGAPAAGSLDNVRDQGGEARVFFGASAWPAVVDAAFEHPGAAIWGAEASDELGFSVADGDFDGDGRADVMSGALLADGPDNARPDAGEAYLILSKSLLKE